VYKNEVTQQRVLQEEANLAFSRVTDAMSWSGIPGLVDSDKLTDEQAAAIESVKIKTDEDGNQTVELKMWNKQPALSKLGENLKLWNSKDQPPPGQQNFYTFFLEICKNGALEEAAAKLRAEEVEAEVIQQKKG